MNAFPFANRFCEVLLTNGDVVELDVSLESFRRRLKVADAFIGYAFIRYQQIQQNLKRSGNKKRFQLREGGVGYEVKKDERLDGQGRIE